MHKSKRSKLQKIDILGRKRDQRKNMVERLAAEKLPGQKRENYELTYASEIMSRKVNKNRTIP